jgi:Fe-S-cluster containining protein
VTSEPRVQGTETAAAVSALNFRCTACGNCCRSLRAAVTGLDVARLAHATGQPASELVTWLAPDAVNMTGEPQSFVELSEGRRLMVLAQRDGACLLLGKDERCSAYGARPRDCRAFPFDFDGSSALAPSIAESPAPRRLQLLPLDGCDYATDGVNDPEAIANEDQARWRELGDYWVLVTRWNRRAWHRRRLHKAVGTSREFLEFVLHHAAERTQ